MKDQSTSESGSSDNDGGDDANDEDNPIARLDAAFVNMTLEFARFLPALFSALGGETQSLSS